MSTRRRLAWAILALPLALAAVVGWALGSASGTRWTLGRVAAQVPGLTLDGVSGTLLGTLRVQALGYRSDAAGLQVDGLVLGWRPWALTRGELRVTRLAADAVTLTLPETAAEPDAAPPAPVAVPAVPLPVWIEGFSVARLEIARAGERWSLAAIEAGVRLDEKALQLHRLALRGEGVTLSVEGQIATAAPFALNATADWQLTRPSLPAMSGQLRLAGDLQTLTVDHRLDGDVRAHLTGTIQPDPEQGRHRFAVRAEWSRIRLPAVGDEALSERGWLTFDGEPDDYRYMIDADLKLAQTGPLSVHLAGHGDERQLRLADGSVQVWGGEVMPRGTLAWLPEPAWDLQLQARGVDPSSRWPEWAGTLDLEGALAGRLRDDALALSADIARLDGRLRGYPVSARGGLTLADGRWAARNVRLRSANNSLAVNGMLLPQLDLDWSLAAPALAQLVPGLQGELQGSGRLRGALDQLAAQVSLSGKGLGVAGWRAQAVSLEADIDPADVHRSRWQLTGRGLGRDGPEAGWDADRLELNGTGNVAEHRFTARLDSQQLRLVLAGSGHYAPSTWQGELQRLSLSPAQLGEWTLLAPVALSAGPRRFDLARLCLGQADGRLCAEGGMQADGRLSAAADWQRLPMTLLRPWLAQDLTLVGDLSGTASLTGQAGRIAAEARVNLSPGQLVFTPEGAEPLTVAHRDGQAQLRYRDDRLEAQAGVHLGEQGVLNGQGVLGPGAAAERSVAGELTFALPDPAPLAVLVPQLTELAGPLRLHSRWQGTLGRPRVTVDGSWRDGRAQVPDLGIALTDVDLALQGEGDRLHLTGQASSGPGKVRLEGEAILDEARGWPVRLKLDGQDFAVAQRTDVEARVSPALDIAASRDAIHATGRLAVPYARITAKDLGEGAVRTSPDEVIVGAGAPQQAPPPGGPAVSADIELALGDEVRLAAYGLTTRLTGELRLHQAAGAAAEGAGQLQLVEGRYRAYGQDLTIDNGRLLFSGPLTNPELDVRASRKLTDVTAGVLLTGSVQQPTVQLFSEPAMEQAEILSYLVTGGPLSGAGAGGTLQLTQAAMGLGLDKSGELTGQLGRSLGLDELKVESGTAGVEGSVMAIGKQLSPDLYLRYLYGLFDNIAAMQVRYLLTRHLRLEVMAGREGAADVIYEMERD